MNQSYARGAADPPPPISRDMHATPRVVYPLRVSHSRSLYRPRIPDAVRAPPPNGDDAEINVFTLEIENALSNRSVFLGVPASRDSAYF